MATEIYLGEPPQYVIDWIKAHSKPAGNPKTKITFKDGSVEEYDWSGEITQQTMADAGLWLPGGPDTPPVWIKKPAEVEIGSAVTSINNTAFHSCDSLTSVMIPDSVTSIGWNVFYKCRSLTSVTIPDSVTSIGDEAFYNCSGLTSVTIPWSVTSIGKSAFIYCSMLTSITFSGKDKATVQGMTNYSWDLNPGCVIHCTDGDITI